jgi:hypothetical protein
MSRGTVETMIPVFESWANCKGEARVSTPGPDATEAPDTWMISC